MQRAYMGKLMELAERDKNVLHLVADSGTGFDEMFKRNFENQMFNFGIAEEHMVAAAAGMATAGKIPFVYTAGAFLAYRAFEFIRDDICFQNLNVKIIGMGSGLSWSTLGPSHHTTEDIAVLRAIPNLAVMSPATPVQVSACLEKAYEYTGPVYIRIGMNNEKEYFTSDYVFHMGKNDILEEKGEITIFSTGSILEEVYNAVHLLNNDGIKANLVNVVSLKPFDKDNLFDMAKHSKYIVTVEEHNIFGGLGGIISEYITDKAIPVKVIKIGLKDKFAVGYGTLKQVRQENGLSAEEIYQQIKENIK